jgi:DNA-binding winged helix-turn-helix (wHTH) protein/tetratricopeptide (TPR) repeat protein
MKNDRENYRFDGFNLDTSGKVLFQGSKPVELTEKSFGLLLYLVKNANVLVPKESIFFEVWGSNYTDKSVLLVNISTLRSILGKNTQGVDYITNKYGKGYLFNAEVEVVTAVKAETNNVNVLTNPDSSLRFNQFVGRKNELNILLAEYEKIKTREGSAVFIKGETGIGKTSLSREFTSLLKDASVFKTRFNFADISLNIPFEIYFELLWDILRDDKLQNYSYRLLKEKLESEFGILLPAEFDFERNNNKNISSSATDYLSLVRIICKSISFLSKNRPLVLIFDDIHFAGSIDLEILGGLIQLAKNEQILIVLFARTANETAEFSEYENWLSKQENIQSISGFTLGKMDNNTFGELITQIFGDKNIVPQIPKKDFDFLLANAGGNPYFLSEIIRWHLTNQNLFFDTDNELWKWRSSDITPMPTSLVGMIQSRSKMLNPEVTNILEAASLYQTGFSVKELSAITETESDILIDLLNKSVKCGVLLQTDSRTTDFEFRHLVQQQVIYKNADLQKKRNLHQKVAFQFVEKYKENQSILLLKEICRHFEKANDAENLWYWYFQAGVSCQQRSLFKDGIEYLEKALNFLKANYSCDKIKPEIKFQLLLTLIDCYTMTQDLNNVYPLLQALIEFAKNRQNKLYYAHSLLSTARSLSFKLNFAKSLEKSYEALKLFQEMKDRDGQNATLFTIAVGLLRLGKYTKTIELLEKRLSSENSETFLIARMRNLLAHSYIYVGKNDEAKKLARKNIIYAERTSNLTLQTYSLSVMGRSSVYSGNYEEAIEYAELQKNNYDKTKMLMALFDSHIVISQALIGQGCYQKAKEVLELVKGDFREGKYPQGEGEFLLYLGMAERGLKRNTVVKRHLKRALKSSESLGDKEEVSLGLIEMARLHFDVSKIDEAKAFAQDSLRIATESGSFRGEILSLVELAWAFAKQGDYEQALKYIGQSEESVKNAEFGEKWRVFWISGKISILYYPTKQFNKNKILKQAETAFIKAVEILDGFREDLDLDLSENEIKYAVMTKSLSEPAKDLVRLLKSQGRYKEADVYAKEWMIM